MRIGFIGLGIMGRPMCRNLLKAGHALVVYDVVPENMETLIASGARAGKSPADTTAASEVVITMLPNSPHVEQAVFGENGIAEGAGPGTVYIDMSSIDPTVSRKIAVKLEEQGVKMLDAPVSGGEPKAIDGTIAIMAGGDRETFDTCKDLLQAMGSSVVHTGAIGSGNVTKLANQIIVALNIAAVSEAMTFAKKAGADPQVVYQAIRGGLAGSTVMDAKVPMMLSRSFDPGFRIELHIKDLANALNMGHQIASPLPFTAQIMEVMMNLRNDGLDKEDHAGIVHYFEKISGATVIPNEEE